jgi:hypothetical protein
VAVIPQEGRRGRIILDLSFAVCPTQQKNQRKAGTIPQEAVNDTTVSLAPKTPVRKIGKVLPRIFEFMAKTSEGQEILLSKADLSDGFWRIIVQEDVRWNFCYVMPDPPVAPIPIVVPSTLQMGWMESPQYFCAATETGWDFIQWSIDQKIDCLPHWLETFMLPSDLVGTNRSSKGQKQPQKNRQRKRRKRWSCWTEPGIMNVPGVHKTELIKKTFQS